ncbi:MAG: alkyl sulfatase dimerization domain-containing protein, partial [Pseudomonadota bacterium]
MVRKMVHPVARALIAALGLTLVLAACAEEAPQQAEAGGEVEAAVGTQSEDAPAGPPPPAGIATQATKTANAALADRLGLAEDEDFSAVERGFLARLEEPAIFNDEGTLVWAVNQFEFLKGPAPAEVNPSLWRQAKAAALHGLFEVTEGIWQVRGYDLSVMTVIEGATGWIIVDPLTTTETAAAALKLINDTLGERPVSALLYTHSHADHFGGARGVLPNGENEAGIPIIAPTGFSHHAVSENLLAGNHMARRASLMFGNTLPRGASGHVSSGLGPGLPNGTISLVLPTEEIAGRGSQRRIDGVLFEFIDAAGTEAPAEFMFYLPEKRALCTAEVASATFHNVLTPRGARVRDALAWSRAIDYVLEAYGERSDVVFASHHWPTWETENIVRFLTEQRDAYRFVHDQTLRHANAGLGMTEAAEALSEPPFTEEAFHARGYYGTLNHNSKAVFQHYFGWWSGVPATYHRLPHEVTASKYVEAMGGPEAVLKRGEAAFGSGNYRWAAELFNHIVFTDPTNEPARQWLASAYEQLGFQAESGAWRSYYLAAALELREGVPDVGDPQLGNQDFLKAVPTLDLFDSLAARFKPETLKRDPFVLAFEFTDTEETVAIHVGPSVVVPRAGRPD